MKARLRNQIRQKNYPRLHPLRRRVHQRLSQMQSERASDHDTVTKRSNRQTITGAFAMTNKGDKIFLLPSPGRVRGRIESARNIYYFGRMNAAPNRQPFLYLVM